MKKFYLSILICCLTFVDAFAQPACNLLSGAGTNNQTICKDSAINVITYSVTTGATIAGLPIGTTYNASSGTINGNPIQSGAFTYTLTDAALNCKSIGTITVDNSIVPTLTSPSGTDNQQVCINTSITPITYSVSTSSSVTGLPNGVSYDATSRTISGTPTQIGVYTYTLTDNGGVCGATTATGNITVVSGIPPTITLSSAVGTDVQNKCINTAITAITYSVSPGGTGATIFPTLPIGVSGSFAAGVFTISGTPSVSGTYNYTVTATGTCTTNSITGKITVDTLPTASVGAVKSTTVCANAPVIAISGTATNGTGVWSTNGTGIFSPNTTITANQYTLSNTDTSAHAVKLYLSVTGNNACSSSIAIDSLMISINNCACAPVIYTQSPTICAGQSITVGVNTYSANGTYTDTLTAANTCDSIVTTYLTILPLPTAIIAGTTFDLQNNSLPRLIFTGSGGTAPYTFSYDINGGATQTISTITSNSVSINVPVSTATTYTYRLLQIQDTIGCSQTQNDSVVFTVNPPMSINRINENITATVFPNPFVNQLSIVVYTSSTIIISDVTGRALYSDVVESGTSVIETANFATGIYFISVTNNKGAITKKIIKN